MQRLLVQYNIDIGSDCITDFEDVCSRILRIFDLNHIGRVSVRC